MWEESACEHGDIAVFGLFSSLFNSFVVVMLVVRVEGRRGRRSPFMALVHRRWCVVGVAA